MTQPTEQAIAEALRLGSGCPEAIDRWQGDLHLLANDDQIAHARSLDTITALTAKLAEVKGALEKAHQQFTFHAEEHDAKAKAAKEAVDDALYWGNVAEQEIAGAEWRKRTTQAKANHDFAKMLGDALAQIGRGEG